MAGTILFIVFSILASSDKSPVHYIIEEGQISIYQNHWFENKCFGLQNYEITQPLVFDSLYNDTLFYDDGTLEISSGTTALIALKLSPIEYPDTLKAILWSGAFYYDTFLVHIWDDDGAGGTPGSDLITPFTSTPDSNHIIILPSPLVITEGEFFIGGQRLGGNYLSFRIDLTHPSSDRGYRSWGTWELSVYQCDFMMRALGHFPGTVHDIGMVSIENSQDFFLPNPSNSSISSFYKNRGDSLETNFEITCTIDGTAFSDTQLIDTVFSNQTGFIQFIPNWVHNQDGDYTIRVQSHLPDETNSLNDEFLREAHICTYPCEYKYDDGVADGGVIYGSPTILTNKFKPHAYPCYIDSFRIHFGMSGDIIPQIIDDDGPGGEPGTVLYMGDTCFATAGWNTFISPTQIEIDSGAFYVGYKQIGSFPNAPALSTDYTRPIAGQGYADNYNVYYRESLIRCWAAGVANVEEKLYSSTLKPYLRCSPNIIQNTLTLRYHISEPTHTKLTIYDISGRKIKTLKEEYTKQGGYTLNWNCKHLPSGIYFAQLEVEKVKYSAKFSVIK